ncbi:hypothetical protein D3C86_1936020 [compost metagenome]
MVRDARHLAFDAEVEDEAGGAHAQARVAPGRLVKQIPVGDGKIGVADDEVGGNPLSGGESHAGGAAGG